MGTFPIIEADWWKDIKPLVDDSLVVIDKTEFKVSVTLPDEVMQDVYKNATVHAILTDVASEHYKSMKTTAAKAVGDMNKMIKQAHAQYQKDKDMSKLNIAKVNAEQYINTGLQMLVNKTKTDIEKAVPKAYNDIKAQLASHRKFKRDLAINTTLKISSISLNVVKLVATGGVDPMAWHSIIKDTIKLVDEIGKLSSKLTDQQALINKKLTALGKSFKQNKGKAQATEAGDALLAALLGRAGKTSLIDTKKELKFYEGKIDTLFANSVKAGAQLTKALDNLQTAKGVVGPAEQRDLDAVAAEINGLAESISTNQAIAREGKAWAKTIKKTLEAMQEAGGVKQFERLAKGLETAYDGLKLGLSWSSAAKNAADAARKAASTTVTAGKNVMRWKDDAQKAYKALAS